MRPSLKIPSLKIAFGLTTTLVVAGCASKEILPGPTRAGQASELTSVSIGLPDRSQLKAQVADIETRMNAYQVNLGPVDPNCASATKVEKVDGYSDSATINISLVQGCDYDVTVAVGNRSGSQGINLQQSSAPSYEGKIKSILAAQCVGCHSPQGSLSDLSTYAKASAKANSIMSSINSGSMPKGGRMAAADKTLVQAWVDAGTPEKDAAAPTPTPGPTPSPTPPAGATNKLQEVYFKNSTALRIKKEDIAGKASHQAQLVLQLQADGIKIGLKVNGAANNTAPNNPNLGGDGNVTPPPAPTPAVQIPTDRDFEMQNAGGTTEKLSAAFKGKYMLLDFSSSTCGYCLQRAAEMQRDSALQKLLDGTKCSHATIVPSGDLRNWHAETGGADTFVGKHSYAAKSSNIGRLVRAFGVQFVGTPTFVLIDDRGQAVADSNGIPEREIRNYCK